MTEIQNLLHEDFGRRRALNPSYSLRSYARFLGINSGGLCSVMNGSRAVGPRLLRKLVSKLNLDSSQRQALVSSLTGSAPEQTIALKEISLEQYRIISDWEHFAVLSLVECPGFKASPAYIARRLGIPATKAREVLTRLLELGYLESTSKGIRRLAPRLTTTNDLQSSAIQRAHREALIQSANALEGIPVAEREFGLLTFSLNAEDFPRIKTELREFLKKILEQSQKSKNKQSVYRLSLQCYPLTKKGRP